MQPYQERVVDEMCALDIRLNALTAFLESPAFKAIDLDEQLRLGRQHRAMKQYSDVLAERIAAFV